jgi:protein-S-isoprenylcysteine O-methyltransferase Ste14
MSRPMTLLVLALLATPFAAYGIYRVAKGLGFLDPPWNAEHEQRRTIVVALFAFILFFAVFLFGHANAWPRVWAVFGVVNAAALVFFGATGYVAARRLWRLRHPAPESKAPPSAQDAGEPGSPAEKPLA